ncbi:MAG: transporter permease [Bacteroidota bacterium]|nr:transporter permease [Bacteroidota bacterium]
MQQEESWSYTIHSHSGFSFASLTEAWHYRDLLWMFVKRDIVTNYKQTILGPLWFFIQPILTTAMFMLIFNRVAKLPTDQVPPVLFYLSGITAWNYFSECLVKTSTTFKDNAYIFGKVYFPRLILPLSLILSNLLKFAIQFGLFIAVLLFYIFCRGFQIHLQPYILLTPVLVFLMAGIALGSGMIITSLTTKYRDLSFLVQFSVQLLMYATPVIYPLSTVINSRYKILILANPLTPIVETFRVAFLGKGIFSWSALGYSFLVMTILLLAGFYIFNKTERSFTDTV